MTHPSSTTEQLEPQKILLELICKVEALESSGKFLPSSRSKGPQAATDPFALRMLVAATAAGFTKTLFTRCPDEYYSWPLEKRRGLLRGASLHHLTKSIVLQNTRHDGDDHPDDVLRSKFLCCVVPYTAKINSDALRDAVRKLHGERGLQVPSARHFNYRLAEDCIGVTGYEPNAVTPLGLKTRMPVVFAKQIAQLDPPTFWLGAGEVSLKWRVELDEFVSAFNPVVLDFAMSEES